MTHPPSSQPDTPGPFASEAVEPPQIGAPPEVVTAWFDRLTAASESTRTLLLSSLQVSLDHNHRLVLLVTTLTTEEGSLKVNEFQSRYSVSNVLPDELGADWTPAKLDARQSQMARRAVHLWRADFG